MFGVVLGEAASEMDPVQRGGKNTGKMVPTPQKELVKHTEIRLKFSLNGGCFELVV